MTGAVDTKTGWFNTRGTDDDVILATRVRFGRNLSHMSFIGSMSDQESESLLQESAEIFSSILLPQEYHYGVVGDFSPLERRILAEKRMIPAQYSLNKEYPLFVDHGCTTSGYIRDIDHIRFASISGGRNVKASFDKCVEIDRVFESKFDYAVSIDWGYLSPDLTSSGLGTRGSFLLHLPGLVKTDMIDNALKAILQHGFSVKGFHSDTGKSMADLYQICNGLAFGFDEEVFVQKLDTLGVQLVHYERKARMELREKLGIDLEDTIMRSYGVLMYCRTLDYMEAIEHLSNVRLGACMGMIDVDVQSITQLFFLVEKAHLQSLGNTQTESDTNVFRASLIKDYLQRTSEEGHHV